MATIRSSSLSLYAATKAIEVIAIYYTLSLITDHFHTTHYNSKTYCIIILLFIIQVVYSKAVKRGWARNYYYTDVVLYSLSTALLLHAVRMSFLHLYSLSLSPVLHLLSFSSPISTFFLPSLSSQPLLNHYLSSQPLLLFVYIPLHT